MVSGSCRPQVSNYKIVYVCHTILLGNYYISFTQKQFLVEDNYNKLETSFPHCGHLLSEYGIVLPSSIWIQVEHSWNATNFSEIKYQTLQLR